MADVKTKSPLEEAAYTMLADAMRDLQESHRRQQLLTSEPTPLDAPVYVEIDKIYFDEDEKRRPLEEFIAEIRKIAAKAGDFPVFARYETDYGYEAGDRWTWLEIGYERPPTKKEAAERKMLNAEIAKVKADEAARLERREKEELKRLKEKFGE